VSRRSHRLPRQIGAALAIALAATLLIAPAGQAAFEIADFDVTATKVDGSVDNLAGSHPFALTASIDLELDGPGPYSDGDLRDLDLDLPPGLVLNPNVVSTCAASQFETPRGSPFQEGLSGESCPDASQVGVVTVRSAHGGGDTRTFGVFNLVPPAGFPAQLGFNPYGMPITLTPQVRKVGGEYRFTLGADDVSQAVNIAGLELTLWGNPWLVGHDRERGNCLNEADPAAYFGEDAVLEREPQTNPASPPFYEPGTCSTGNPKTLPPLAYLTLPTSCTGPLQFTVSASSWQQPATVARTALSRDAGGQPVGLAGCDSVLFNAAGSIRLSTDRTSSASGADFDLVSDQQYLVDNVTETGRLIASIRAPSQVSRTVVRLPEGVTVNPSVGAGLGVCDPGQYAAETANSAPGAACPNASKLGEVSVQSPLFAGTLDGSIFLAQPDDPLTAAPGAENPFDSMLALYLVFKSPQRGVLVKVAGQVAADPGTGQLVASFDDLPQLPYSHVNVHFRDGQRSPLATPSTCGAYFTGTGLSPWRSPAAAQANGSLLNLKAGIGGAPCPSGTPPFAPRSTGGTLNRNAGSYSPFYLHLTREDAEQEITSYSASFPKGLLGNVAGVPYCPEAAIERAARNRGFAETASPSCSEASKIGRTYSGYGLGSVLAYAPGNLYLAGPYRGSAFSIVAVNSATVGPFDLGVIIVRSAIRVDRRTAQVSIDSSISDPIPHIIDGIPIHLRDVRVYLDRPRLTLNPTSCDPFSVASVLTGSGASFGNQADDTSAGAANPFQVSNCSALGFKPPLSLWVKGGTRRGKFPALRAVVTPRPGDGNIGGAQVTLPPSLFLEQAHIETICTRPQFNADACPAGSVYGNARAFSPLLGAPLEGPVYLRASDNPLPDLVAALKGQVEIDVVGRIDSHKGGIRTTFDILPDAPVSKFELSLRGGKRGVLAAAENLCQGSHRALARLWSQSNATHVSKPKLKAKCKKGKGKRKGRGRK
jgi:hypothetical protein